MLTGSHVHIIDTFYVTHQDAFSLQLSKPLTLGNWYQLTYYIKEMPQHPPDVSPPHGTTNVEVGISESDTLFGEWVHTSSWPDTLWSQQTVVFQANIAAQHITCRAFIQEGYIGVFVDNFELTPLVGVPSLCQSKQLLRVIDVLGRESKQQSNVPLFYIYDDGTVEKRITFSD